MKSMVSVPIVRKRNMSNLDQVLKIYHHKIPSFLVPFFKSEELNRIDEVGMHCGMEYTSFPFYKDFDKYSRFEHSLGVALIVYHFTHDEKMTLAGLFHDIATPSFAHVIDFLKGDHDKQEATEERTSLLIKRDDVIQEELAKLHLKTSDVDDYHLYPIADNDSPRLSADRLEYTLHNLYNYKFASLEEIQELYDDLKVTLNEEGVEELAFQHQNIAKKFTLLTLKNSHIYVTDEDRYGMEYLARMLKRQIEKGILTEDDLYTTEKEVIIKLLSNKESKEDWLDFRSLSKIKKEETPSSNTSYKISSKKRFINPLIIDKGRISKLDKEVDNAIRSFLEESFDYYIDQSH